MMKKQKKFNSKRYQTVLPIIIIIIFFIVWLIFSNKYFSIFKLWPLFKPPAYAYYQACLTLLFYQLLIVLMFNILSKKVQKLLPKTLSKSIILAFSIIYLFYILIVRSFNENLNFNFFYFLIFAILSVFQIMIYHSYIFPIRNTKCIKFLNILIIILLVCSLIILYPKKVGDYSNIKTGSGETEYKLSCFGKTYRMPCTFIVCEEDINCIGIRYQKRHKHEFFILNKFVNY